MRFFSDNAATVHPAVLDALVAANTVDTAYDGDALSRSLDAAFSDLFETEVAAIWVTTGTAANALALAALCPPYGGVVCHHDAHVQNDECGAPEFYTHGAKLLLAGGTGAKLTPETIAKTIEAIADDVHRVQPHAISITNATEYGLVYRADEVAAIGALARDRGLGLHMDGARFANAVIAQKVSPAELTWRAGVDVLSFGVIKNGGMNAEAVVFFDPDRVADFEFRRKRAGQLACKGRYASVQLTAYVESGLWRRNAERANRLAARIAAAAPQWLSVPFETNQVFMNLGDERIAALSREFGFYAWGPAGSGEARFVCSWDTPEEDVDALCAALTKLR